MRHLTLVAAILLGTLAHAHADTLAVRWYDTIRPHGHKRPDAIGMAAVNDCNQRVGEADDYVSDAFKACMSSHGYRYMSSTLRHSRSKADAAVTVYNRDSRNPQIGWHTENGMRVCHQDCDNPEIPGSGAVCRNTNVMGMPMRECVTHGGL